MSYIDEIIQKYKGLGYTIVIKCACDFPTLQGRFPDGWCAYSIAIKGSKPRLPTTAFPYLNDLEQDLRCNYGVKSDTYKELQRLEQLKSKPNSKVEASAENRLSMIGAKKIEMKFARSGLFCNIAPASRWERTRLAALRMGQHPDRVWGISIYDAALDTWSEIDEAYLSLRNVAGALTQYTKEGT